MENCPVNDQYKIECGDGTLVPQGVSSLTIRELIGEGAFGKVYLADMSGIPVAVKHMYLTQENPGAYDNEICTQVRAAQYGIAPNLLGYWKCEGGEYAVFVMDYISGMTYGDYIMARQPGIVKAYLNIIRRALYQNQALKITHQDLHFDNIFVSDDGEVINFVDYGASGKYFNDEVIIMLLQVKVEHLGHFAHLFEQIFVDLIRPSMSVTDIKMMIEDPDFKLSDRVLQLNPPNESGHITLSEEAIELSSIIHENRLDMYRGWYEIFKSYYSEHGSLPGPDDIYMILYHKLKHLLN